MRTPPIEKQMNAGSIANDLDAIARRLFRVRSSTTMQRILSELTPAERDEVRRKHQARLDALKAAFDDAIKREAT